MTSPLLSISCVLAWLYNAPQTSKQVSYAEPRRCHKWRFSDARQVERSRLWLLLLRRLVPRSRSVRVATKGFSF